MNTTFTKFIDIFGRSQIIIDERIQRKYEWASMKIIGLIDYINESALSYKENYAANDCKKDIGTMLFFEVPMEERKNYMKISNYGDEGNQRLWSIVIIGKAMYIATKSYSIDNGEQEVLTAHNKVLLDIFLKNVKNNFIPEEQKDVFDYLMNLEDDDPKKYTKTKVIKAFNAAVEEYKTIIDNSIEEFNDIVDFFLNELGCNTTYYRPTSLLIRKQKYNALNTAIQEQSKLHRAFSNFNEAAEIVGYNNFSSNKTYCETIAKKYGVSDVDHVFSLYYYIKAINLLGSDCKGLNASIDKLTEKLDNVNKYSYEYFQNFFNDFELLCALLTRKVKWDAIDTIENRRLGALLTAIIDLFTKFPRQSTAVYFLKILTECFEIENNCIITGTKSFIDKSMLIKLLTQIFVYKICIDCQASNNTASDERSVYAPLIKCNYPFNNDIFEEHYLHLKKVVEESMAMYIYKDILYKQNYKSKGLRIILSIVRSEGETFDEVLRQYVKTYYDFNGLDTDHVLLSSKGGEDSVANLRLYPKLDNRRENSCDERGRYIGNDSSFPLHMRNDTFTEENLKERYEWMTNKVHDFINQVVKF